MPLRLCYVPPRVPQPVRCGPMALRPPGLSRCQCHRGGPLNGPTGQLARPKWQGTATDQRYTGASNVAEVPWGRNGPAVAHGTSLAATCGASNAAKMAWTTTDLDEALHPGLLTRSM